MGNVDADAKEDWIALLGTEETPDKCLFFILGPGRFGGSGTWKEDSPADGLAFLVKGNGILATAAHVLWKNGLGPGDEVGVFGADIPLRARANILEAGWRGPRPDSSGTVTRHPTFSGLADERPAILLEDCALLQVDRKSVCFDDARGRGFMPQDELISQLRVMPVGVPGYRPGSSAALMAWWVLKSFGAPRLLSKPATFLCPEPSLHCAFSAQAPGVTHGFSGSPLWDPARHLAVGFVREGISDLMAGDVLGTDGRALRIHGGIPLAFDSHLNAVASACQYLIDNFSSLRHVETTSTRGGEVFIEPLAGLVGSHGAFEADIARSAAEPAMALLVRMVTAHRLTCVCSGAGTGKSTLVREFARRLADRPHYLGGERRVFPLVFDARELGTDSFGLDTLFGIARKRMSALLPSESELAESLEVNGVGVFLVIDGLDEIEKSRVPRLLSHCLELCLGSSPVLGVITTTDQIH